jgi:hypothetical protein
VKREPFAGQGPWWLNLGPHRYVQTPVPAPVGRGQVKHVADAVAIRDRASNSTPAEPRPIVRGVRGIIDSSRILAGPPPLAQLRRGRLVARQRLHPLPPGREALRPEDLAGIRR